MDQILGSHLIDREALRADDFDQFSESRSRQLLSRIAEAMGKPIVADVVHNQSIAHLRTDNRPQLTRRTLAQHHFMCRVSTDCFFNQLRGPLG